VTGPAVRGPTKYDEPGRADRYASRPARRHAEEVALVDALLAPLGPPRDVLDAPCGTGRMAAVFLDRGARVRCADLSPSMRAAASRALADQPDFGGVFPLDLRAPLPDPPPEPADLVLCFRFFHHLPDGQARRAVLRTLAALSRRHVLLSFFHPVSAHAAARAARRALTGRRGDRHAVTLGRLADEAAEAGLALVSHRALAPYRRDLWAALFERR
jgi:SAM-dependent methyltransferase